MLIVAPTGADAMNMHDVLAGGAMQASVCPNLSAVALEMDRGCGAILVTEEAFDYQRSADLRHAFERQPTWSDLPLVLVVSGGRQLHALSPISQLLGQRINLVLVERPLGRETLLTTIASALRARRRQYEVRALLEERDEILASLEQRVADRTAKLLELNTELETFSYSVSHDLRAPLRSIETYARILCDDHGENLEPEARNYLQRIAKNAERMDRLMQDVLTFSRIARADVNVAPLDLDELLLDVIDQYADLAAAQEQISARSPLGMAMGHGPALMQCFSNLLQNALKFAAPGVAPRIEVSTERRDDRVRINVRDNGIGIEPTFQTRIFGLFERASPAGVPGTGVGLAIVKKAAERMGGTVGVDSTPGQGSCFWIELSAVEADAPQPAFERMSDSSASD